MSAILRQKPALQNADPESEMTQFTLCSARANVTGRLYQKVKRANCVSALVCFVGARVWFSVNPTSGKAGKGIAKGLRHRR